MVSAGYPGQIGAGKTGELSDVVADTAGASSDLLEEGGIASNNEQQHLHDALRRFKRLRWQNCIASACLFAVPTAAFGSSPLVDLMNKATPESLEWFPPGVWHFAVQQLLAQAVIMPLSGGIVKKLTPLQIWMAVTSGILSPLSIGIAAGTNLLWLQYFGAAMGAFGFAAALECDKVVALQWWSVDGSQAFGSAFQGGASGVLMLVFSLLLGSVGNAWGLAGAACAEVLFLILMGLFPLWLALQGELGPPPPELVATIANLPPREVQAPSQESKKTPTKVTFSSPCSLIRSAEFWQVAAFNCLVPFCGFGMKLLLTSVFQTTYGTTFLDSSFLAAGSIVLFVAARIVMPLISRRVPLISMMTATLCITGILYASYPSVIAHLSVWWLMLAKSIAGACFAGLNSLGPLLMLEVFSASDLPIVFAAMGPARGLGWGFGPVVGYYIYLASKNAGIENRQSYNMFFYICAALTLFSAFNIVLLRRNLLRREEKAASDAC